MTLNGWLQIALYCVIVTLLVKPFGGYMTKVFNGERHIMTPVLALAGARHLRDLRRRRQAGSALGDLCGREAVLHRRRVCDAVRAAAAAGGAAVQFGRSIRCRA